MEHTWQSEHLQIDGMTVDVRASKEGVTSGRTVDGVYASDLLMTPEQADAFGTLLLKGATKCRQIRAGGAA